jgi:CRP-like cAMP-binding protein
MAELDRLAKSLHSVQHFKHLNLVDLITIVSAGQVRHFRADEIIFREDQPCAGMHVLIFGEVHLKKTGPHGQTGILAIIKPVIMFNEVSVLDGGPNPISALAVQDCTIWQISYDSFQALLQQYPQVGLGLLKVLAARNRQMITQYEDVSFRPVLARVAKLLLDLSDHGKVKIQRNQHSITEMAACVASVPEAISRSLNTLKTQGTIETNRTEIVVLAPIELTHMAQLEDPINN